LIVDERVSCYIKSLTACNSNFLEELREKALEDKVPIIKRETESLLKTLLLLKKPKKILEVGTAVAYSSLVMAEVLEGKTKISTIENYEKRVLEARKNIAGSNYSNTIHLIEEDASKVLKKLVEKKEKYDFIFMDAAKGQYINWLEPVIKLLNKEGVLCSDNVLQGGDIVQSRYLIERRDRSIHSRLREYLYELTHREELSTTILSLGDGVALTVLKK
jgi:hypothetical protein